MRKRSLSARKGAVTTTLVLTLAVATAAACDRPSDTSTHTTVDSVTSGDAGEGATSGFGDRRAVGRLQGRLEAQAMRTGMAAAPAAPPPVAEAAAGAGAAANDARVVSLGSPLPDAGGAMLIRNGQASVQVARLDDAVGRLRQTATQLGGFVANTAIVGGKEEHRSATLEIRVPSAQFDAVVTALGGLGTVESVSATVQDVGDEYVDLRARAANARHMEARLVEMLARRTGKLSEALTVEQELRRVREEVERYDARLNWLERRTALSSLEIALHEPMSVLDQRGPSPIVEAFAEAWRRAVGVVAWTIASLGVVVPLGLLIGGMVVLVRRMPRIRGA